ncbi:MAG TPA: hypothetical protein VGG33_22535, partial [Polyangia bacterium]
SGARGGGGGRGGNSAGAGGTSSSVGTGGAGQGGGGLPGGANAGGAGGAHDGPAGPDAAQDVTMDVTAVDTRIDSAADATERDAIPGVPSGKSAGCGKAAPAGDSATTWIKHDVDVTGVDPAFIAAHPANVGGYTWTRRNYFLRLPANYDNQKAYAIHFGGGGCGNTNGLSGNGGGFVVPGTAESGAIQIGLSYVYDNGACFKDEYPNTPELQYFDSIMKDLDSKYCFDRGKVFVAGYSSGAWEAYTLAFARGGVIRGIATAAGGLRRDRPTPARVPFAALLLTGQNDGANPISGPTGSAAARDLVLQTNGCVGTATTDWPGMANCKQYTGCPAAYPVIWCTPPGDHTDGGGAYKTVISKFWSGLPNVP